MSEQTTVPVKKFKKGDRVEFTTREGVLVTGYIKSVTKTGIVKLAQEGGEFMWKVGIRVLRDASTPAAVDEPSVMDKWGLKGYRKTSGHDDSQPFVAKITLNGKVVGEAYNDGWGGANLYYFDSHGIRQMFTDDAKAWWLQMSGSTDSFEIEGLWIDWCANERPVGITARKYAEGFVDFVNGNK